MAKLYTVKEIAQIMNEEFGNNPADYKFTEERVRARIRAARDKGLIKPIRMGYDRRTRYYSEEDVEKLKSTWIGPELPEFTEHEEDTEIVEQSGEVEVRPAKLQDLESILALFDIAEEETDTLKLYLAKMLKSKQVSNFVAIADENEIIGWAQVEISSALSILKGKPSGVVRLIVIDNEAKIIAARSLAYRAQQWLSNLSVHHFSLEIPMSMSDMQEMLSSKLNLEAETSLLIMSK